MGFSKAMEVETALGDAKSLVVNRGISRILGYVSVIFYLRIHWNFK